MNRSVFNKDERSSCTVEKVLEDKEDLDLDALLTKFESLRSIKPKEKHERHHSYVDEEDSLSNRLPLRQSKLAPSLTLVKAQNNNNKESSKVRSSISQSYDIEASTTNNEENDKQFKDKYGCESVIGDKGLRKFYEHLDQINRQEVTAFQMYNRVRE